MFCYQIGGLASARGWGIYGVFDGMYIMVSTVAQ